MELSSPLKRTALFDIHVSLQAKIVPFAGYEMPVQYSEGIIKEHLHTRSAAGLFDISHMGQIILEGPENLRQQLERIMPGDFRELSPGHIRYSFLLNEKGGIIDDLMVTRPFDEKDQNKVFIIVNAAGKFEDFAHIQKHLPSIKSKLLDSHSLLALQGPLAAKVLSRFCHAPEKLRFMQADKYIIQDVGLCSISRSGYTGEDGFEISVPNETVAKFFRQLLAQPEVLPIGLGARDSLRLEAGLCLYGHDLNVTTTPVEADLLWAIGKRRRAEGQFIGFEVIKNQLETGVLRKRVGIKPEGRALARENTEILNSEGKTIGSVTSGGFSPSVDGPICMGYVDQAFSKVSTPVSLVVRGNKLPARVIKLPFTSHHYVKG